MANKSIKGITVEIGGNTTGLDKALKSVNNTSYKLKNELKEVEKGLKFNPSSVELLSQKNTLLAQAVANAKDKLDSLRMVQSQVEQQFQKGEIGEEAYRAFQRELIASENELKRLESQLKLSNSDLLEFGRNGASAANSQRELAESAENEKNKQEELNQKIEKGKEALGKWGDAAEKVKDIGVAVWDGITKAVEISTAAVVAGAAASVKAYEDVYAGTENVIKATGATGAAADELNENFKNVLKTVNAIPADVGAILGEVNTRFGYTDDELEAATVNFIKFADIVGADGVQAVQLVAKAMYDANIPMDEYQTVLDQLAVASQASGISFNNLATDITKYGATLRALNFDTSQSIALFTNFEKNGVNTDTVMSGLKKSISNWTKENKDASVEFKNTLDIIASAPDITDATTKSIEVFGEKAGAELVDAIRNGKFEYQEFVDLLDNSIGTVRNTYDETQNGSDKIKVAFNGLKVQASEVGGAISDVMGDYVSEGLDLASQAIEDLNLDSDELKKKIEKNVAPVIDEIKSKAKEIIDYIVSHKADIFSAIDEIKSVISDILEVVKEIITWIIDNKEIVLAALMAIGTALLAFNVVTMIQGLVAAFQAWKIATEGLTAKQIILNAVMAANPVGLIVAAIAALVAAFIVLWNTCEPFKQFWLDLWEEIKKTVATFCDYWVAGVEMIKQGFEDFINTDFMQRIIYHFQQIIDFIKNIFTGDFDAAWENIKNIFKNIWDGFVDIAKKPLNSVLSLINSLISGINLMISGLNNIKIEIPSWVPEVGGESIGFDLPQISPIPLLAKGGILSSGSAIVGEAGAELLTVANGKAVVQPLTNNNSANNSAVQNTVQPMFSGDIVIPVHMYPNSAEFSRVVITATQLNAAMTGGR